MSGRRRTLVAIVAALGLLPVLLPLAERGGRAVAYPTGTVELTGHGFGHGRGMGQWGSLGYALRGSSWQQILDRYYGGTTLGPGPAAAIRVRMLQNDGLDVIVTSESSFTVAGTPFAALKAARVRRVGANSFAVDSADSCGGPWAQVATASGQPQIDPGTSAPGDNRAQMLQLCLLEGIRWVRGSVRAVDDGGTTRTVNVLGEDDYLRGVVPRESPASWGDLGGGAGMNALRAQAVAARSYSINDIQSNGGQGKYGGYADTCNTELCQVYGGVALQQGTTFTQLEDGRSNAAVADTAGLVRLSTTGTVARTEFSSSTGGYSAGGTFPAVVDEGDDICVDRACNANHTWTAKLAVTDIESKYPQLGSLVNIEISARNGLGDWGGRVTSMVLRGTSANVTQTGGQFRSTMKLKSDWFQLANAPSGGVNGYWLVASDGGIFSFGAARFFGSTGAMRLNQPVVGMAATPAGDGYWLVARDGGIFTFGAARFFGSTGAIRLNQPIVGMAPTPSGNGYWLVATDGGIFAFGDARFFGSTGAMRLNKPVVGMAPTKTGNGYWLVATDGGVFSYGDAVFRGSTGSLRLAQPIVGMQRSSAGAGYWMVAADGGIFAFGDAPFLGSRPDTGGTGAIVGMKATRTGGGYLMTSQGGGVYSFGDAPNYGGIPQVVAGYRGRVLGIESTPAPSA